MRDRLGGVARWLADNRAFLLAVCLVALLARYIFDWVPDDRPAPPPRPIAAPTAVATPVPLDIAYPTATPTAAPTATPTVAPTPIAALRGAGQLLYAGRLGGRNGIIASNADGTDRRLLAQGAYNGAAWSPDGQRFVAYAANAGASIVDLFTAEGRLLQHLAPPDRVPYGASWSRDSGQVAVVMGSASRGRGLPEPDTVVWLMDGQGVVELALGKQSFVVALPTSEGWSATDRLALGVYVDSDGNNQITAVDRLEIWTVDAQGGDQRKLTEGDYRPFGWSRDGTALYALGGIERGADGQITEVTQVVALDGRTGEERTLTTIDDVARQVQSQAGGPVPDLYLYNLPSLSPAGDRIALWLRSKTERGTLGAAEALYLATLDEGGRLLSQKRATPGTRPLLTVWSPDGARLAYSYQQVNSASPGGIRIVAGEAAAGSPEPIALDVADITMESGYSVRWSSDGRWLAFARAGTIEIVSADAPARSWVLGAGTGLPNWRPMGGP